jgi:4'-phosphopantetheinyl transferase
MSVIHGAAFWSDLDAVDPSLAGTHVLVVSRRAIASLAPTPDDMREAATRRDAVLFLMRRAALRRLVARVADVEPETVVVARALHNAPGAPILAAPAGFHVSVSARGDCAALAVSRRPVGVDMELLGDAAAPALNVLAPSERDALAGLPAHARPRAFLELWTAKEAYLKALGLGLSREPGDIAADFGAETFRISDGGKAVAATTARKTLGDRLVACVVL